MEQIEKFYKILIVDEDTTALEELSHVLEKKGYDIMQAADGNKAFSLIKKYHIDIVIAAWIIPGLDGIELCHHIREEEMDNYVYYILLTVKDKKEDRLKGFKAGIDAYVTKPPDFAELEAFIKVGMRIVGHDHEQLDLEKEDNGKEEVGDTEAESENKELEKQIDIKEVRENKTGTEKQKKIKSLEMVSRRDQAFAKIGIKNKLISKKQLAEAFTIQQKEKLAGKIVSIDSIFFQKKWISEDLLNDLRVATNRQLGKRFGVIAVKKGYVTQEQVYKALKDQAQEYKELQKCRRIGDILMDHGALSEEQRDQIRLEQKNVEMKSFVQKKKKLDHDKVDTEEAKQHSEDKPGEDPAPAEEAKQHSEDKPEEDPDPAEEAKQQPEDKSEEDKPEEDQEESGEEQAAIKEKAEKFRVIVSADKLEATIKLKGSDMPDPITAHDIKKILKLDGIINGIIDDGLIAEFLKNDAAMQKALVIAKGTQPVPGKESEIKYHFDRDYLTAGKIKEDGEIDYRERGEIPRVKKGDLIVEKTPLTKGIDGVDVLGNPIHAPEIEDIKLRCEEGTELSEDGLKVYAKVEGQPHATVGGKISVFSSFDVDGDVDYKTGNIDFDGNINVKGAVKDGFSIKGGNLTAKEILGAKIHVKGDVVVKGGIMGAIIEAEGQVSAKFIKEANIRAYGNVIAEKEILDSKIRTSGEFIAERGKIISSLVAAKKGLTAKEIGTDVSEPCTITIGKDEHIRKIVQGFDRSRDEIRESLKKTQSDYGALVERQTKTHKTIADTSQAQNSSTQKQYALKEKIEELRKEDNLDELAQAEEKLLAVTKKIDAMENEINKQFDEQEQLDLIIGEAQNEIEKNVEDIVDLSDQKDAVVKWSKKDKAAPRINVRGSICAKTKISGVHSSIAIKETVKNVVVEECPIPDSDSLWEMKIEKPK